MALRRAGHFRELRHGDENGPSLRQSCRQAAQPDEPMIIHYLTSAPIFSATGTMVDDYLNPQHKAVARLMTATDGIWLWPLDLPYYVGTYHVVLPVDFVDHMRQLSWEPPNLTNAELARLTDQEFRDS